MVLYRVSQGRTLHCLEAGLAAHLITFADRPSLRSFAGHRHRVSWRALPLARGAYLFSGLEQGALAQHGVHDDGEATGERDLGLLETASLDGLQRPGLQCEGLARARQDRVGRFVEQRADGAVAMLGDPARPVEFARLVPTRDEATVGTSRARPLEPARLIDGGSERSRGLHADAQDGHQGLTGRRGDADRLELATEPPS